MPAFQKIPAKNLRKEFRRLLLDYVDLESLAELLDTTKQNIWVQKKRGYMSKPQALLAEKETEGSYSAKLLAKEGVIRNVK